MKTLQIELYSVFFDVPIKQVHLIVKEKEHSFIFQLNFSSIATLGNGTGIEIWIQSWRFLLYMVNHFSCTMRINTNQRNITPDHFTDCLFHVLQKHTNQCLRNYHISMISPNILFLGSFFSQHRPFALLWVQLQYTLTP